MALAPIDTNGSAEPPIPNDPYGGKLAKQWWLVFVLTLAATLGAIDRQVMQLLLVPIKLDLGLTDTQISLLYGLAFSLANALFLLPAGYLADRVNRRNLLLAGVAVWSLMTAACGFASNYVAMFLARSGVGFGESVIQPTGISMLRSAVPHQRRGRAFSIYAMAIMLGTALAMLIGGILLRALEGGALQDVPFLGQLRPWQTVLILIGLLGLPLILLVTALQEPGRAAPTAQLTPSYRQTLAYLHANRSIFYPLLTFNTAAGMISLGFGAWVVPMMARVWHLPVSEIGVKLGLMMLFLPPIGLFVVGWLMDRAVVKWRAEGPLLVGLVAIVIVTVVKILALSWPSLSGVWILLGLTMLTGTACIPITNTVVAMIAPPENLGRITSIQYIIYGIFAGAISATLIAIASDRLFSGEAAIAKALILMCSIYGTISFIAAAITIRNLRARAAGQNALV